MKNTSRGLLLASAAASTLMFAGVANAAITPSATTPTNAAVADSALSLSAGGLDGAYADIADQIAAANAAAAAISTGINTPLTGFAASAAAAEKAITDYYVDPVNSLDATEVNLLKQYVAAKDAKEAADAAVLAYDGTSAVELFNLQQAAATAGSILNTASGAATVAGLGSDLTAIDGLILTRNSTATALAAQNLLLAAAQAESAGLARSDSLLTAAAASANTNISLAAGALTGDEAAAGSNYETEVLGALTNHETRITKNTADIAANTAAIAKETADRVAADLVLQNKITAETDARIAADNAIRKDLGDRIASSTATAIALGGSTILPDAKFTLSGNVGFYQGAQAIAINAAAQIGPKAYVTAAFGGGLNKQGEIGGRVGFVFGF